ncbi:MAG: cell filamentation protein Fic, partial [Peptococcaceae bacterium]|nr:cell filamentation protein Fic [Peptococcaceae bacterium]
MLEKTRWQFELEEYIRQGEPDQAEKSEAWQIAIGLQQVDGLYTSAYLLDTAKEHIEGKITITEAQQRIHNYYEQRIDRKELEADTKEADVVSARIAQLLGEQSFQFSPIEWKMIHRRLFEGIYDHAGQFRT